MKILPAALALLLVPSAAIAQPAPSPYTSGARYDGLGRVTGTISADPDAFGSSNPFVAIRNTYDPAGRLVRVEHGALAAWQSEAIAPSAWSGFTVFRTAETEYDGGGRKLRETLREGSAGPIRTLTQYSYDQDGQLECTAIRMTASAFASLPASACEQSAQNAAEPDRITRNLYDEAGQLLQVQRAVATPLQHAYALYTYTLNGRRASLTDGNGNRAEMRYDGHDRQVRWVFPSPTAPGTVNEADYEEYGYDPAGNRTSFRRRDGATLTFHYDSLNRLSLKDVPERAGLSPVHTRNVHYGYDNRGLQLFARFDGAAPTNEGVTNVYDGFGRLASTTLLMDGASRALAHHYDPNGNRVRLTHPDGQVFHYWYDGVDRYAFSLENGLSWLQGNAYGPDGLIYGQSFAMHAAGWSSLFYDGVGRLTSLAYDLPGTGLDVGYGFTHNPAGQLAGRSRDNDAYAFTGAANQNVAYFRNGLNQYTMVGGVGLAYDANGNLTADPGVATGSGPTTFLYDVENRLVAASGARNALLRYDPLGRLYEIAAPGGATTRFLYDGDALVAEYDANGALLRRYVHGANAGADDPQVWYEGAGLTAPRFLHPDHQGSIVSVADASGGVAIVNAYDEYGVPNSTNQGRFQYTGQTWLAELGLYHYKARLYSPALGRFLQTDPIGYEGGINLYGYVENDPVNATDPSGTQMGSGAMWRALPEEWRARITDAGILAVGIIIDVLNTPVSPGPDTSIAAGTVVGARAAARGLDNVVDAARPLDRASTLRPGPHARESVPVVGRPTAAQRREVDRIGDRHGCHTCGERQSGNRSGRWTPDHQPPTALNRHGSQQRAYPHCDNCSRRQAGEVTREVMRRRRRMEEEQ